MKKLSRQAIGYIFLYFLWCCLQCFDAVCSMTGKASVPVISKSSLPEQVEEEHRGKPLTLVHLENSRAAKTQAGS